MRPKDTKQLTSTTYSQFWSAELICSITEIFTVKISFIYFLSALVLEILFTARSRVHNFSDMLSRTHWSESHFWLSETTHKRKYSVLIRHQVYNTINGTKYSYIKPFTTGSVFARPSIGSSRTIWTISSSPLHFTQKRPSVQRNASSGGVRCIDCKYAIASHFGILSFPQLYLKQECSWVTMNFASFSLGTN